MTITSYINTKVEIRKSEHGADLIVLGDDDSARRVLDMYMGAMLRMNLDVLPHCKIELGAIRTPMEESEMHNWLLAVEQYYSRTRKCSHNIHSLVNELLRRGVSRKDLASIMGISYPRMHHIVHDANATVSSDTAHNLREYIEKHHPDLIRDWSVAAADSKARNPNWLRRQR